MLRSVLGIINVSELSVLEVMKQLKLKGRTFLKEEYFRVCEKITVKILIEIQTCQLFIAKQEFSNHSKMVMDLSLIHI